MGKRELDSKKSICPQQFACSHNVQRSLVSGRQSSICQKEFRRDCIQIVSQFNQKWTQARCSYWCETSISSSQHRQNPRQLAYARVCQRYIAYKRVCFFFYIRTSQNIPKQTWWLQVVSKICNQSKMPASEVQASKVLKSKMRSVGNASEQSAENNM